MNQIFETQPLTLLQGAVTLATGALLFLLLELEKQMQRLWNPAMKASPGTLT